MTIDTVEKVILFASIGAAAYFGILVTLDHFLGGN
jgi:hypothetical protein